MSLFKAFQSNPCFKSLDPFLPSVALEGFIAAKDALNLLPYPPEEGKETTGLEVLHQCPRGPHQKHIVIIVSFGILV